MMMAKEIRPLTGIRGIAACWIVIYHLFDKAKLNGPIGLFLNNGYLAVDLFFILSGYVMALSYGRFVIEGWTWKKYGVFLKRRFARIYPLYFIVTLIIIGLITLEKLSPSDMRNLKTTFSVHSLLIQLALMQAWGFDVTPLSRPAWSISAEAFAYLIFPLLGALTIKTRHSGYALGLFLVCLAVIAFLSLAPTPRDMLRQGLLDIYFPGSFYPLIRCLCEFTMGLATYRAGLSADVQKWARLTPAICIASLILIVFSMMRGMDVAFVALLPVLILALGAGDNPVTRFIGGKVVFFLGEISYALYLLHTIFLKMMEDFGKNELMRWLTPYQGSGDVNFLGLGIVAAGLVLCSWLAYRIIEKPCRDMLHG